MNEYLQVLRQYADFNGRAPRRTFWMFIAFNSIICLVVSTAGRMATEFPTGRMTVIELVYYLAVLLPGLAVAARRLHDTNRSGKWLLLLIVPLLGAIVLLVFLAQKSDPRDNEYGPSPKSVLTAQ